MAKIGTAHVEIKPVLNEAQFDALCKHIEEAVEAAVARGLTKANVTITNVYEGTQLDKEERQILRGAARAARDEV